MDKTTFFSCKCPVHQLHLTTKHTTTATAFLLFLLTSLVPAGCTTEEADGDYYREYQETKYANGTDEVRFEYEGVWTVNKQVVDTACLTMSTYASALPSPEGFLVNVPIKASFLKAMCLEGVDFQSENQADKVLSFGCVMQGYSQNVRYYSFFDIETSTVNDKVMYRNFMTSFIDYNDYYYISLLGNELGSVITQSDFGQVTIAIPLDAYEVNHKDLHTTGQTTWETWQQKLSPAVTLYFTTTKRVK